MERFKFLLKWDNYVSYHVETSRVDGEEVPCSLNPLFTSQQVEFVSAYQLVGNLKKQNDRSYFETIIDSAVLWGMKEHDVRRHLEYTILTDFILTNTDRHFNNFGFLYNPEMHKFVSMAPIFDTGNSLFYNREMIPTKSNLLDIKVTSFCEKEVAMLRHVQERDLVDLRKLEGFSKEAEQLLTTYTAMPKDRAAKIFFVEKGKPFLRLQWIIIIDKYAIRKSDYHDFENYLSTLELKEPMNGLVPDSTYFCLDEERNIFVGAVNIRHYLSESLLLNGGYQM